MKIRKSQFVTSLSEMKPFPGQGLPEIALAGKSNVGKSSPVSYTHLTLPTIRLV